jgi:hypothetical protein
MINLIFTAITKVKFWLNQLQAKQLLSIVMLTFILLSTNIDPSMSKLAAINKIDKMLQQDDNPDRPKTTGEWNQQAKEVQGKPGERLKRIGEQSVDAVKEFGSMYPEVAKNSVEELKNSQGKK